MWLSARNVPNDNPTNGGSQRVPNFRARGRAAGPRRTADGHGRGLDGSTAPRAPERARGTIDSIFKKRHRYPT